MHTTSLSEYILYNKDPINIRKCCCRMNETSCLLYNTWCSVYCINNVKTRDNKETTVINETVGSPSLIVVRLPRASDIDRIVSIRRERRER